MEKEDNSTERLALAIAERLYKQFYGELMTALTNSIKNFDSAIMYDDSREVKEYYKGKRDAFAEIAGRLEKEYRLAGQPFRSKEESLKLLKSVEEQIRVNKNKAVILAKPIRVFHAEIGEIFQVPRTTWRDKLVKLAKLRCFAQYRGGEAAS